MLTWHKEEIYIKLCCLKNYLVHAPNISSAILYRFRSPLTLLNPTENGKIQGLCKAFEWFSSTFQDRIMWLFLAMPWVCLQFVIVVFPDHTHLLFFKDISRKPSISRYFNKLKGCANLYRTNIFQLAELFIRILIVQQNWHRNSAL